MMQTTPTTSSTQPNQDDLTRLLNETAGFSKAIKEMLAGTDYLNKQFGQVRQRASEMMKEVSESTMRIVYLGGQAKDAYETLAKISEATGRNVIASAEVAGKLYASSKVINADVKDIVKGFTDIGYRFDQIGGQLETMTTTLRNMGLNTTQVTKTVIENFGKLNEYHFEGGVQGLTKMAAKATMFRIDMKEAFNLAERVMKPEGAIATASAFQRLGVAVGEMGNPFALMTASLKDPGALQDTIVNIGKQFTYFDKQAKSFRISEYGMLTLRELSTEMGVSYDALTKAGLAASELDDRLSQISPAIKFEKEEDKQFLSNIAKIGDSGKYEVTLEDGRTKQLSEITQEEFRKLIDQQRKDNMPMEQVAKKQLSLQEDIASNLRSIVESVTRGVASSRFMRDNLEATRDLLSNYVGGVAKQLAESNVVGKELDKALDVFGKALKKSLSGQDVTFEDLKKGLGDAFKGSLGEIEKIFENVKDTAQKQTEEMGRKRTGVEIEVLAKQANEMLQFAKGGLSMAAEKITNGDAGAFFGNLATNMKETIQGLMQGVSLESITGTQGTSQNQGTSSGNRSLTQVIDQTLTLGGTITVKIEAPPGVDKTQMETYVNSEQVKKAMWDYTSQELVKKGIVTAAQIRTPT